MLTPRRESTPGGMGNAWRGLSDQQGPERIVLVRDHHADLEAVVVVDSVAVGPAMGGVRMMADLTVEEVVRVARTMTLKCAAAGLPYGGAKAGIFAGPADPAIRERLVRAFARSIRQLVDYIPGPDMGTDETCMAWIHDEIGRAAGLPAVLGGIPLDDLGATGFGLAVCAEVAEAQGILRLAGASVVVEGFGAVGRHAARFLAERGARIIAASDSRGGVVDRRGLDLNHLFALKADGRSVSEEGEGSPISAQDMVALDCDIWVPAARPDVFTEDNAGSVKARLILEGANIPATPGAEERLHERGVIVVPDVVANAGGVICAAVELRRGTPRDALALIEERIRDNVTEVLSASRDSGISPRRVAEAMAQRRLYEAESYRRRLSPTATGPLG